MIRKRKLLTAILATFVWTVALHAQTDTSSAPPADTLSKFDKFNKKAEKLFKIIPVPIFGYSTEAGSTIGLAKFNLFQLSKNDTISKPSKISGVASFTTKGRINVSVSNDLIFDANRYMILSYINYRKQPQYIFGIGNDVKRSDQEQVTVERMKFVTNAMRRVAKDLYVGVAIDVGDYFKIKTDSNSFLIRDDVTGLDGGWCVGAGFSVVLDSRDNRYNPYSGDFVLTDILFYSDWMGSSFNFTRFNLDLRKYFNPWLRHVIAVQATTTHMNGNVPFFELAQLGGNKQMRGYYEGALRDNVLVDGQVEYRMPVWNIFGVAGWVGTGRVADKYSHLALKDFWISYGAGLRIRVDSKNNTNLRFDMGFGPKGIHGFYLDFAEAF